MAAQCVDHRPLDAAALEVDLQPDAGQTFGEERERLVERRDAGHRESASVVRDDDRPVRAREHVELEHVAAELDGELERLERVLGRECRGPAMADAGELARGPAQLDQHASHDDDRAVVGELALRERAAIVEHRLRELRRRAAHALGEQRVETGVSVQLAVAARLDHAVGVEHDDASPARSRARTSS